MHDSADRDNQCGGGIESPVAVAREAAAAQEYARALKDQYEKAQAAASKLCKKAEFAQKFPGATRKANAWTQWGKLKEIVVGVADNGCFLPKQPCNVPEFNPEGGSGATPDKNSGAGKVLAAEIPWPLGPKKKETIEAANRQLDNLARVLEARGIRVLRPDPSIDWNQPIKTPMFEMQHQYCCTCPRDSLVTVGNTVIEAAMSRRDRHFEVLAFRDILNDLWREDDGMQWLAAPKPSCKDSMYKPEWWDQTEKERYDKMYEFEFCITNDEPVFDAADIMRCGKDIFVQLSTTCNKAGIEWLRRAMKPYGVRVHMVRFPYDLAPSHLDCTFVPLRPGLVLTNPDRPIHPDDKKLFELNGWRFVDAPLPVNPERPWASMSSKWLSMNVITISTTEVIVEEQETALHAVLEKEGFEVIKVPFRDVYEFGGGLHCSTWDTMREDSCEDFFPKQA